MLNAVPPQRVASLEDLGVSAKLFTDATEWAAAETRQCTKLDAPAAAGVTFWSRTNRYLAEILTDAEHTPVPWRWTHRDSIMRVVHPDATHAITAISGKGGVGDLDAKPRTKNPKGSAMAYLVENNAKYQPDGQGVFLSRDDIEFGRELDDIPLWFLLYERGDNGKLSAELSLPVKMEGKYVNQWVQRIPLFRGKVDPGVDVELLDAAVETSAQVSVEIKNL
ncbi:hypothetical protein ACF08W_31485 [Streptomyces sp. NPDC015144]|uniref:hypothetical protein n=1 Tax=Streptomyces sp. NPDC015144 TaxID=3364944 RepID=UPI0036FC8BB1